MSAPALSVVITNYNYGRFLGEAIDSALGQGADTEVVVVDDGSTDGSRDVLATYGDAVRTVLKSNGGQASAFNAGFAVASGDVVLLLDADDVLEPEVVRELTEAMAGGAVHARWQLRMADAGGRPTGRLRPETPPPGGDLRSELVRRGPAFLQGFPSGHAFSRAFLQTALPMPAEPYRNGGVDLYLTWLAAASGRVVVLDRPLSRYRRHHSSDGISGTTDERIDRGLAWATHALVAVADRLGVEGSTTARWAEHEWWHQVDAARRAVRGHVPVRGRLLVADDYLWVVRETFADRPAEQLAVSEPDVDRALVDRMQVEVRSGPSYVVLAGSSTWWLDHYPRWAEWMAAHAGLVHRDPVVSIYAVGAAA